MDSSRRSPDAKDEREIYLTRPQRGEVKEAVARLLSTLGAPLDERQMAAVEIRGQASEAVRSRVSEVVDAEFNSLETVLAGLAAGRLRVY